MNQLSPASLFQQYSINPLMPHLRNGSLPRFLTRDFNYVRCFILCTLPSGGKNGNEPSRSVNAEMFFA